jgi:small conductance mechanosensitive channel
MIRQLDMTVGVSYTSDLRAVERTIRHVLANSPKVLKEPNAIVGVSQLADFSINFSVKPWVAVADFATASAELYDAIVEGFRRDKIEIPFPQREIRVLNYEGIGNGASAFVQGRPDTGI